MLEFNSNHKSLNTTITDKFIKKLGNILLEGVMITTILFMGGCAKTVDCDVEGYHVHKYEQSGSFNKWISSEKENFGDYSRTDEYMYVDGEEKDLIKFENKKELFRIEDNKDQIDEITSTQHDYLEYRYEYPYLIMIPHFQTIGKVTIVYYTYIPATGHSWTKDKNYSNLTGEVRTVHYVYYGYKIVIDEDGKRCVIQSEPVDNIDDLPPEFIYVRKDFYKVVDINNKNNDLDYEEGPAEDHQLTEEQQKEYEQQQQDEARKEGSVKQLVKRWF